MKFNIASTLKTVAQRLNPDLEIPNAPPPAPAPSTIHATTTTTTTTTGRKTSSPPLPQSSFSASSSPSPKKPRKSRSTSWTKTRNRASSNVSSVFRKSSASISLPVFMGKMAVPPVKVEEEVVQKETVGEDGAPVSLCRDFAVEKKEKEREIEMPMDTPQRPSTPLDPSMQMMMDTALMSHAYTSVFTSSSPPAAWETQRTGGGGGGAGATLASVPEPDIMATPLASHSLASSVYSLPPSSMEEIPESDTTAATTPPQPQPLDPTQETAPNPPEETQNPPPPPTDLETKTPEPSPTTSPLPTTTTTPVLPQTTTQTATSTCLCTAIHLSFPLSSPTPRPTSTSPLLLCTCLACSKTCASVYAAGYSVDMK
ncbi:hypothetical protein PTMSG1_04023 [Pyrenophora teres f. maculata]|nr:hypothetical protein PTMSG1_04023 [Pyrenophora teres f. maculata]